jgi:hypothetical protein
MSYAEAVTASLRRPHTDLHDSGHKENTPQYVSFSEQVSEYPLQVHHAFKHASLEPQNVSHALGTEAVWVSVPSGLPQAQAVITSGSPAPVASLPFAPPGLGMPQSVASPHLALTTPQALSYSTASYTSLDTSEPRIVSQPQYDTMLVPSTQVTSPPSHPAVSNTNESPPHPHTPSFTVGAMLVASTLPTAAPQCSTSTLKFSDATSTPSAPSDNPFATQSPPQTPKKKKRRSKKAKAASNRKLFHLICIERLSYILLYTSSRRH